MRLDALLALLKQQRASDGVAALIAEGEGALLTLVARQPSEPTAASQTAGGCVDAEYSPTMDEAAGLASGPAVSLEATLVAAARDGDRAAFGRLYDRFAPMVHGLLLARVPRSEVDDLVQEVFLQAMRRLDSLRNPEAFGPWLAAIARNRARDLYRSAAPVVELPDDMAGAIHPEGEALSVLAAIRRLPEAYRETLVLRLVEGRSRGSRAPPGPTRAWSARAGSASASGSRPAAAERGSRWATSARWSSSLPRGSRSSMPD